LSAKLVPTHDHVLLSHLILQQPGRPGLRIYNPRVQGGSVIPPGSVFPFRRLLRLARLQGLRLERERERERVRKKVGWVAEDTTDKWGGGGKK
jgi:hypothetical protein